MQIDITKIKRGTVLVYNDGRQGHSSVRAKVRSVDGDFAVVKFEDRARVTTIGLLNPRWMDYITIEA